MFEEIVIRTDSAEATEQLGEDIGRNIRGSEVIELVGDVGAGKTTFTRGFARGAGSNDHVASPTFTISKVYKTPDLAIHHFDFYRLNDAGILQHELQDILTDPKGVTLIEWGEVVQHVLPEKRVSIEFIQTDSENREVHIHGDETLLYLLEART